jgi:IstB-like ATP binding protein
MLSRSQSLSEGGALLTDQEVATALLDRLLPPSPLINSWGQSYRLKATRPAGGCPSFETPEPKISSARAGSVCHDIENKSSLRRSKSGRPR